MPKKRRILLVHWNRAEAEERAAILRTAGYDVDAGPIEGIALRAQRSDPPTAFVIDLSRIPSHGRDVGMALRGAKATRSVPLVFVDGEPDKVAKVREQLPDAVFTDWRRIRGALSKAIARPLESPVVPASSLAGYSGTPLPKKLGIKPAATVVLLGAPDDFERTLGPLPEGAKLTGASTALGDLTIWFVRSLKELSRGLPRAVGRAEHGPVWIAWPKKAAAPSTDVTEREVREKGLAAGLVDYKVCAIDATWSGLLFALRREKRGAAPKRR
jgi:CheY-like chemotaxis protein